MLLAEATTLIDTQIVVIVIVALQVLGGLIGLVTAYLVKTGKVDAQTVANMKDITGAVTGAVDKLKDIDADAAKKLTGNIVEAIGDKKPILDAFLKSLNLNPPK